MAVTANGTHLLFNDGSTQSTAAAAGGNYVLKQYTSPATWTKPANLKSVKVTATVYYTGGGGGGGAAIYYAPASSIPGPVAVTAGTGTNSFGALASATAGTVGSVVPYSVALPVAGGVGSGGTLNIPGSSGTNNGLQPGAGPGGSSILGIGSVGTRLADFPTGIPMSLNGTPGTGYGAGGSGAGIVGTALSATGGTGAPGIVIIEEFY
ncbi:MAG: hypothetical protein EBU90_16955 [Proteobacteria bacterium]|nr:hypothetical protein [Pseudomonadota bacterium]